LRPCTLTDAERKDFCCRFNLAFDGTEHVTVVGDGGDLQAIGAMMGAEELFRAMRQRDRLPAPREREH